MLSKVHYKYYPIVQNAAYHLSWVYAFLIREETLLAQLTLDFALIDVVVHKSSCTANMAQ